MARGGIVDDAALAAALRERRIAAAGLDVFEGEPAVHPDLLALPNVVLTPHIASATVRHAARDGRAGGRQPDRRAHRRHAADADQSRGAGRTALTQSRMPQWLVPALLVPCLLLLLWIALRRPDDAALQRLEAELRDELGRQAQAARADLANFQRLLLAQGGEQARTQNEQLRQLAEATERRLLALQDGNEKKLDQMRATVDEKLHATLEQRLGESFKQVADRLEQVHKGLGEMQMLARDVGALNRVLSNVKTRGIFGEVQLAGLLEQVFTPEQYATNVATVPGSNERVEFALRLPGQRQRRRAAVAAHRRQVPARRLRAPARRAGTRRRAGGRGGGQGHRDAAAAGGAQHPREVRGAAAHHRLRASSSCPPKACTPRRCAGPGCWKRCSANTRSCWPARPRCWPR